MCVCVYACEYVNPCKEGLSCLLMSANLSFKFSSLLDKNNETSFEKKMSRYFYRLL